MEFRILGPLEAREDGVALALGGAKQRALLAVLLLHANEVVSTEELIAALWETPPARPAKAVQVYASRLRRALGGSTPTSRTPGYVVEVEPDRFDLERFRRLREEAQRNPTRAAETLQEALSLWRGRALAEFEREPFARAERLRLEELRLEALEQRIEAELALGRHAQLVSELEALVAADPLREGLRRQLMLALYRSGRQEEALAAYRDARRILVDELGIEPGRALQDLEQAILRQDRALELADAAPMPTALELPTGTVTFLCTDVDSSTALLKKLGTDEYARALEKHRAVLREVFAEHHGVEVDTQGDSFLVAFARATDAVSAASAAQERLADGPLRVRMGLHTGEPVRTSEGYAGLVLHTTARICAAGHGAQILVSQATRDLADVEAKDLGLHRLKDLDAPVRIYQFGHAEFPALASRFFSNLPVPATPFLGREHEVEQVVGLLGRDDAHLVTLVGPGGTGKTRLAIEAAAEAPERFPDGITWIPLAPLHDPALVLPTVAHSVGVGDTAEAPLAERLANALASRRTLLLLDNLEHLLPRAAADVALLARAGTTVVLVTSRERLQLQGEHVYSVPTLTEGDAVELFRSRADALGAHLAGDGVVAEICARLDRLPLALELAAARLTLFTPGQLLERLGTRLDLLKGGRDADTRHQTLRATIEWSHDLLDEEEQRLFRQLSIFADGCTYEAAEEVCAPAPDTLQSLIDKSLLRRREGEFGPRFWMLETIREFAAEQLAAVGESDDLQHRYLAHYAALAEACFDETLLGNDALDRLEDERENLRLALDIALSTDPELALELARRLMPFWMRRGEFREGRERLAAALTQAPDAPGLAHAWALRDAALLASQQSDLAVADSLGYEALALFRELGDQRGIGWTLNVLGWNAMNRGDFGEARRMFEEAADALSGPGDEQLQRRALMSLATVESAEEDHARALELIRDVVASARREGSTFELALALGNLGVVEANAGETDEARRAYEESIALSRQDARKPTLAIGLCNLGYLLRASAPSEALAHFSESLTLSREMEEPRTIAYCLVGGAGILAAQGNSTQATTLLGAASSIRAPTGMGVAPSRKRMADTVEAQCREALSAEAFARAWDEGAALDVTTAADWALRLFEEAE
jgi:predicted ATPase/DNA-binding SARP family transcriptional activator